MQVKIMLLSSLGIDERYLAHTPDETLIDHSNLTLSYLNKILKLKNLDQILDGLLQKIDSQNYILLKEIFINTVYLHDLGKTNPFFQAKKMKNQHFKEYSDTTDSSDHSLLSSQKLIDYYLPIIQSLATRDQKEKFRFITSRKFGNL